MVGVSYATAEPSYERISGLTFATVTEEHRAESRASWGRRDVLGSVAVLVMILMAYLYFRVPAAGRSLPEMVFRRQIMSSFTIGLDYGTNSVRAVVVSCADG